MHKLINQFIEVAQCKSVSKAAKKLYLSQPTLTHNIKKLEQQLQVSLLTRHARGVELTEAGELLYEQGKAMRRLYDQTLSQVSNYNQRHQKELRVGTGDAWWVVFMRDFVWQYHRQYPEANLSISLGNNFALFERLLNNEIELFIGHEIRGLLQPERIYFHPLFVQHDLVYVRKNHPLLNELASTEDIAQYPVVDIAYPDNETHNVRQFSHQETEQKRRYQSQKSLVYGTNSLLCAIDLLRESDAIMVYPESMQSYFAKHDLLPVKTLSAPFTHTVGAYIRRSQINDPHIESLIETLRSHLETSPELRWRSPTE